MRHQGLPGLKDNPTTGELLRECEQVYTAGFLSNRATRNSAPILSLVLVLVVVGLVQAAERRPNLVFILTDNQGPGRSVVTATPRSARRTSTGWPPRAFVSRGR